MPQLSAIPKFVGNKPIDAAEAEKFMQMSMDNEAKRAQLKVKAVVTVHLMRTNITGEDWQPIAKSQSA